MNPPPDNRTTIPADAYPSGVYAADQHVTPDTIRVEPSETALVLWVAGLMIGVPRDADDTRLRASMELAWRLSQAAERFGALVRADLERRQRAREAEPIAAAMRAAARTHAAPAAPPAPAVPADMPAPAAPDGVAQHEQRGAVPHEQGADDDH